ncbi:MAG TPA: hypothetical protein VML55_04995 [Planctomycetaceae bacterium]|nr:hypothetical protein [Planctomycetaceae bacterium]
MNRLAHVICASFLVVSPVAADDEADTKSFSPVNLDRHFNHKLSEDFGGREGNRLTVLPGEHTFDRIKFRIGKGVMQLGSTVYTEKPEQVEGIAVGRKFAKLHILHATAFGGGPNTPGTEWHVEDDTRIGEYVIHYEDKTSETVPIVFGKDVRDWWVGEDEKAPSRSRVVWTGDNPQANRFRCRLRLYLSTWENPEPGKRIASIDYIGRKNDTPAAPFCVAITGEE